MLYITEFPYQQNESAAPPTLNYCDSIFFNQLYMKLQAFEPWKSFIVHFV